MMRRLFTAAAVASLLLCLASVAVAVWASGHNTSTFYSRDGRLWDLGHARGRVVLWSTPWPRNGALVTQSPSSSFWQTGQGVTSHELWAAHWMTGRCRMPSGSLDPWGSTPPVAPSPFWAVGLECWRCVGLLAVLPVAWILWRFRMGRAEGPGFQVKPVQKEKA